MFCWHKLKESYDGNCPGCRTPYKDTGYTEVIRKEEEE